MMKKFYSFWILILTLFSCVIFSACGDKFKNLSMSFFDEDGNAISSVEFLIDKDMEELPTQTLGIEFGNIDKEDVGQIVVYSKPYELVEVLEYKYDNLRCFVTLMAKMSSGENAEIVVHHLASSKKQTIDLNIEQKTQSLEVNGELQYVVGIPENDLENEGVDHFVDFSELVSLTPGSTDKIFFKSNSGSALNGVTPIKMTDLEQYEYLKGTKFETENVCVGFNVKKDADVGEITIYPVTYIKGYEKNEDEIDKYKDKTITIMFRHLLNENNVGFYAESVDNFDSLQLIANDETSLNTMIITPKLYDSTKPTGEQYQDIDSSYFDIYKLGTVEIDGQLISAIVNATKNEIVVSAHERTEDYHEIKVVFDPVGRNAIGDIRRVEKVIKVQGVLEPELIKVIKGEINTETEVSEGSNINIFDYYSEGNSLGTRLRFEAVTVSNNIVYDKLSSMKIIVDKNILSANNDGSSDSSKYALQFHVAGRLMTFESVTGTNYMQSETLTKTSEVRVRYINVGGGTDNPLQMTIQTQDTSEIAYWDANKTTISRTVNFNRLQGVKSMDIQAGTFSCETGEDYYSNIETNNPTHIYLNRNEEVNGGMIAHYISIVNDSVLDVNNITLSQVDFNAKVVPLNNSTNPLKIMNGITTSGGVIVTTSSSDKASHQYSNTETNDVIAFVVDKYTQIGEYQIEISQEGILKASVICVVYDTIEEITADDNICLYKLNGNNELEISADSDRAFKNDNYTVSYPDAQYIVASGEHLKAYVNLPNDVIASNMIDSYSFEYNLTTNGNNIYTPNGEVEDYFQIIDKQDNFATLQYKQGTYIDGVKYLTLNINVKVKTYLNIITPGEPQDLEAVTITFFIYEKIEEQDVSINNLELTLNPFERLGAYNESDSKARLVMNLDDTLKNYINVDNIIWKVDGEINKINYFDFTQNPDDKRVCDIQAKVDTSNSQYTKIVSVEFNQFENRFVRECVVYVENPIISERVIIVSEVGRTDDSEQTYYINLKQGETYEVKAQNYSDLGEVTRKGFVIQVVDEYGVGFYTQEYFEIDQDNLLIKVKKVDATRKFRLVVFAKDALSEIIFASHNLEDPSDYLIVWDNLTAPNQFKKAYFVADIILSNGSEANPYLIKNAKDFWQIDDSEDFLKSYYMLMTSISLKNSSNEGNQPITNFKGSITTYEKNIYHIYDIKLNNTQKNIFSNFYGTMFGVQFVVDFSYDITSSSSENLGVFDELKANATLTNVGVEVAGNVKLNGTGPFYFGSLVAQNSGEIEYKAKIVENAGELNEKTYTYNNVIGVTGSLNFEGNANVYIGGLVAQNFGTINGSEQVKSGGANNIVFSSSQGRTNALSSIFISSTMQTTSDSAIGGVVGRNESIIMNAYVQATINASNNSNVGGVVGYNKQSAQKILVDGTVNIDKTILDELLADGSYGYGNTIIQFTIQNVKSASMINGQDCVGGITGLDSNGTYLNCDYQITSTSNNVSAINGLNNVGGIAGKSTYGKFLYCSVMSYKWDYQVLQTNPTNLIKDSSTADILGTDYAGGIVGLSVSSANTFNSVGETCEDRTLVAYSTVNAYIKSSNNVGGIFTAILGDEYNTAKSILTNVYFIGKLEGTHEYYIPSGQYLALSNSSITTIVTTAYSLNITNSNELIVGAIKNNNLWTINDNTGLSDLPYWAHNTNINGGYVFVSTDGSLPIFDVAPEKIEVSVKDETNDKLKQILRLNYYDFTLNAGLNEIYLDALNNMYNKKNIYDLLKIEVSPENLGTVVLSVKSSNTQVIDISLSGVISINGVGTCKLTFASVLNPEIKAEIDVIVDYPLGEFNISSSPIDNSKLINDKTIEIPKGSSKQFYVITKGNIDEDLDSDGNDEIYAFRTKDNPNVKVIITLTSVEIENYIKTSGIKESSTDPGELTMKIDNKTPFMISALKKYESGKFNFVVKPYITINNVDLYYTNSGLTDNENNTNILQSEFDVSTMAGATKVSFSYDESIVYLNDTVMLTMQIATDVDLATGVDLQAKIEDLQTKINGILNSPELSGELAPNVTLLLSSSKIDIENCVKIYVESTAYDETLEIQTIIFRIEFNNIDFTKSQEQDFRFRIELGNEYAQTKFANVDYTILSQRINKIEIKNYYFDNNDKILYDVLKPLTAGEMIIDMVPNNAYYDYLEISDITGDEEILFIQVDKDGNAISLDSDMSSDKKGIKLYATDKSGRIIVKTQIDRNYTSKMHTVEVRAYSSDDTLLRSDRKLIDVKMLPEISMQYVLPNGNVDFEIKTSEDKSRLLANGAPAHITIQTRNTTRDFEYEISGDLKDKYELVNTSGYHYELRRKSGAITFLDVGKIVKLTIKAYADMGIGSYEESTCSLEFEITNFVIHSVSVNNSIGDEIYGYYDNPLQLEFFFDETDISFYNEDSKGEPLWDTQYRYSTGIENTTSDNNLKQIYEILKQINGWNTGSDANNYVILNNGEKAPLSGKYTTTYLQGKANLSTQKFKLDNSLFDKETNNVLTVQKDYKEDGDKYLAISFKIKWNASKWEIDDSWVGYEPATPPVAVSSVATSYVVDSNYILAFRPATEWYEPEVVKDEEDFIGMESGGRYILQKDLSFDKYVPLDVDLVEFDGNGHIITINGFDSLLDAEIKAGLFKQTYENMIVKNLTVKYVSLLDANSGEYSFGQVDKNNKVIKYADLCNDETVAYTSASFGGIAAINNGIITNCKVLGSVALQASVVENVASNSGTYEVDFFIGGMVAENSATGYITNSTSSLSIFSQSNIGGFAHTNSGKISSCSVETQTSIEENSSATIYGYHQGISKTIVVQIAGFVVENSGDISMSYVDLMAIKDTNNEFKSSTYFGTMSAKDISAGFVYSNSGKIYDSYAKINAMGVNNNTFAGFVYENSGQITRAYTFINMGVKQEKKDSMFAPIATQGIDSCIEFVGSQIGYSNQVEGLETLDSIHRYNQRYYEQFGFAFGSKESGAVWTMSSSAIATLVSTEEKVDGVDLIGIESEEVLEDGEIKTKYTFNFGTYGTKSNPYILSDISSWNDFFSDEASYYMNSSYRVVKDIDFTSLGTNPSTSSKTFRGNIQGNNMILNGIMLYSNESLESIGLFAKLEGRSDPSVHCAVRNLTINTTSVWASSTKAVGILAGVIDGFDIYNIKIDAEGVIMVGKNAVGGLAGLIEGNSDVDSISSNIGVNSTRASILNTYSIYVSKNNNENSPNLSSVYYAGSVAGIVDLYNSSIFEIDAKREINEKYFQVKNIEVSGNVVLAGDTVGGAFGMIGERVKLENLKVNISGSMNGSQYSAGLVGENRGIILNAVAYLEEGTMDNVRYVAAGAVGLNLGGLLKNVNASASMKYSNYGYTVGGIVGRNIYGAIQNAYFDGEINAYFTGGIVGANYSSQILRAISTGTGAISTECKSNKNLFPTKQVEYTLNGDVVNNFENIAISGNTFNKMVEASKSFYTYQNLQEEGAVATSLKEITKRNKVLGVVIGISYTETEIIKVQDNKYSLEFISDEVTNGKVIFNQSTFNSSLTFATGEDVKDIILKDDDVEENKIKFTFASGVNVLTTNREVPCVMYLMGAIAPSFDAWTSYSDTYILLK